MVGGPGTTGHKNRTRAATPFQARIQPSSGGKHMYVRLIAAALLTATAAEAAAASLTCSTANNLENLVSCIRSQMPQKGSGIHVAPTAAQRAAWQDLVTQMLGGACGGPVPDALRG